MSPPPASAITIADGQIIVDAELLAPKLGLLGLLDLGLLDRVTTAS